MQLWLGSLDHWRVSSLLGHPEIFQEKICGIWEVLFSSLYPLYRSHCICLRLSSLFFIHLFSPCLAGWIGEAVSAVLSRKEMLPVFEQTPNLSELLHTGCSDLGKPCWCAELFCSCALMFICSTEVSEHYCEKLCFRASLHFKFMPKISIDKVVWCFHTGIKPICFYEGNVPG